MVMVALAVSACQADPGYGGRTSRDWIAVLHDGDAAAREDAAAALGQVLAINPKLAPPITALVAALSDTSDAVRVAASRALSQSNVQAMDALPGLATMLTDSAHADVRIQGVRALGVLLSQARDTQGALILTALLPASGDRDTGVRRAVAQTLGPSGAAAPTAGTQAARRTDSAATKTLRVLATDPDSTTRLYALDAVAVWPGAVMDPGVREAIRLALRDPVHLIRAAAAAAPRAAAAAVALLEPELLHALSDSVATVRLAAVHTLGAPSTTQRVAVRAALQARLRDADSTVRVEAAHALSQFHARGVRDAGPAEPSLAERCAQLPPRTRGC